MGVKIMRLKSPKHFLCFLLFLFINFYSTAFPIPVTDSNNTRTQNDTIGETASIDINSLSSEHLLDYAEEVYAHDVENLSETLPLIAGELRKKWGNNIPYAHLTSLARDPNKTIEFRKFMVDAACFGVHPSPADREVIASNITTIAMDKTIAPSLRHIALKKVSRVIRQGVKQKHAYIDQFVDLLQDPNEDPAVRAASITAIQRLNQFQLAMPTTETILTNPQDHNTELVRHAAIGLVKSRLLFDHNLLLTTVTQTNNRDVFCTAVYAASLVRDEDVFRQLLPTIIDRSDYFSDLHTKLTIGSAIDKHQSIIIEMLNDNNIKEIDTAIKACVLRPSHVYLPALRNIKDSQAYVSDKLNEVLGLIESNQPDPQALEKERLRKAKQAID